MTKLLDKSQKNKLGSIELTEFARLRLFPKPGAKNKIQGVSPDAFEAYINSVEPEAIKDGYADFCKLAVYKNWTDSLCMAVPITKENKHLLCSGYEARVKNELPVLTRWFKGLVPPKAEYLIVILYSKQQILKEGDDIEADWGVVGCLPVAEPEETPMAPITIMRNALGVKEGGSGVALDSDEYKKSVKFWEKHANWR